ncbi:MAG: ASCH domain-containing protein [Candidatus Eisenbacteria bacterium]|nr:ASCH domain-containing protein [Candidatus Latescibacterota bacterium]MBD3301047.1 ASCH domain-containing protein [Candidatus Eisenbacteria bacterium]
MERLKRIQFYGRTPDDDHLVREILAGLKTATVSRTFEYDHADGEFDDGGWEVGDLVEVYDLRQRLRATIRITEVYPVRFGAIPERLWRAEVCRSAEHFRQAHRECWPDTDLTDDYPLVAMHFELVSIADSQPD